MHHKIPLANCRMQLLYLAEAPHSAQYILPLMQLGEEHRLYCSVAA